MSKINVPISLGELIDKITILEIKARKFKGEKLKNVEKELTSLKSIFKQFSNQVDKILVNKMHSVNLEIWEIETEIREYEKINKFDHDFINIARSVYKKNDLRASIKREINLTYNSDIIEEKSH